MTGALAVAAAAACVRPAGTFMCSSSDQCTGGGICQPIGWCSFYDPNCQSGQRYSDASGGLSGVCVGDAACDPRKPFGAPVPVQGIASAAEDGSLRLSPDETTAYFF